MSQKLTLVNGLPTMVETSDSALDESIYYSAGLAAGTDITIPNSGSFNNSDASDIHILVNQKEVEVTRDFTVLGTAPHTQIEFLYDLPNDAVVRFKKIT